jgi:hypothetical protein
MYPEMIAILVNTSTSFDDNVIVYSNWDMIDEAGKKLRCFAESNYNYLSVFDFNVRLLDGQQINVNTTLIPNSLFSKELRMNSLIDPVLIDYDFFLRAGLSCQTKFHLIEKQTMKFRIHKNQLSHQNILKSLENLEKVKGQILSELDAKSQDRYFESLIRYRKHKPISKKFMTTGLKLISAIFPHTLTNDIILFYLNKIRQSR